MSISGIRAFVAIPLIAHYSTDLFHARGRPVAAIS